MTYDRAVLIGVPPGNDKQKEEAFLIDLPIELIAKATQAEKDDTC